MVGVKGDIEADAVVKVKPDRTVTMYDVTYRPAENTNVPASAEEQDGYSHKDPKEAAVSQPVTKWFQEELVKDKNEVTAPYTYDEATGYHNTALGLSLTELPAGK